MPAVTSWDTLFQLLRDGTGAERRDETVVDMLALGHGLAPGTVGCSLTELHSSGFRTPVASNELARELDRTQYAAGDGPCVRAARTGQRVQIDALSETSDFSSFRAAALAEGVRSSLSLPVAGQESPTALNLYSTAEAAFASHRPRAAAALLARVVGSLSVQSLPVATAPAASTELERAREHGRLVNAAVERLMVESSIDRAAAFGVLIRRARDRQVSLISLVLADVEHP